MHAVLQNNWITAPSPNSSNWSRQRQASLDTLAICSTDRGERIPYPCVPFITHLDAQADDFPSTHTMQTYNMQHFAIDIHTPASICAQKKATCMLLNNACTHLTHNPPTQKLRRVFPWCRITALTLPSPLFPFTSPFLHLGAGKHWQLSASFCQTTCSYSLCRARLPWTLSTGFEP